VTECLQEPLRFGPDNAPWMDAVKAILGCGGGDNRLSSVSGAGADPSLEGGRQLSATRPMNNGGGGGGSDSGRRVENIRSIEKRYGFGCVLSKPGDKVQNWHQDGDTGWEVDKAARTVIVFLVPVHVTHDQGPLEIIRASNTVRFCALSCSRVLLPGHTKSLGLSVWRFRIYGLGFGVEPCPIQPYRQRPINDPKTLSTVTKKSFEPKSNSQSGKRHQVGRFFSLFFFADFGRILHYLPLRTRVHKGGSKP
jgi:hypothetical protein